MSTFSGIQDGEEGKKLMEKIHSLLPELALLLLKDLQGDHPKYLQAAGMAKHYAVHNGPEKFRHEFDAVSSMKDMWETYLPAFEALVTEAKC